MVNMNVPYRRVCHSLAQLQDEIQARFPGREQNKGFYTGYPAAARAGGWSGHYVDNHGIAFAYDIGVDIEGDGTGLKPADAEWLCNYLCEEMNPRFQYLIYRSRIRGNHTGWKWAPYNGASPHNDHIHISVVDVQHGEPSGISPEVFDSTASWGVNKVQSAGTKPEPIKEVDVGTSPEKVWDERMQGGGKDAKNYQARTYQIRTYDNSEQLLQEVRSLQISQGKILEVLNKVADGEPFDPDKLLLDIQEATAAGMTQALLSARDAEKERQAKADAQAEEGEPK